MFQSFTFVDLQQNTTSHTESGTTHRSILMLQERTRYFTILQEDLPSLTRIPFASFVLVIQQLVWHQHEPASLPVVHKMSLWSDHQNILKMCLLHPSLHVTLTHLHLYCILCISQRSLTLFTRNPSLRDTCFLSGSMLFTGILATELCLFLPAQVFQSRGECFFSSSMSVSPCSHPHPHTHTCTPTHTLLNTWEANPILQFLPGITWGRTDSFRGSARRTMWKRLFTFECWISAKSEVKANNVLHKKHSLLLP